MTLFKKTLTIATILFTTMLTPKLLQAQTTNGSITPVINYLLLEDNKASANCALPNSLHPQMMRLYLGKALEGLRQAAPEIGNLNDPFPNVDPFDYYYDGAESIDIISKHAFDSGLIGQAEYKQMQSYRANAVSKFLDISDDVFESSCNEEDPVPEPVSCDRLNLGNEAHFTGVANWYLDEKAAGRGNTPAAQRAKEVLLYNAREGTNWHKYIEDTSSSTYINAAPISKNMREVALTLWTETEALRVLREDNASNLQPYQAKFDTALQFSKSHADQISTGRNAHSYAWEIWYQSFYIGMTASALLNADEYLLEYTGARDPEILPRVKALADFLLLGSVKYNRYDISGASAGDIVYYEQVVNGVSRGQQSIILRDHIDPKGREYRNGDIQRGYVELTSPTLDPENTVINLVNGSNFPQIGNSTTVSMLNKDTDDKGFWGWRYADRETFDINFYSGPNEALNTLINPMFAWLSMMGQSYTEDNTVKSYANAYWQSWYGVVVYGDGWEFSGSNRKQWNQMFWETKRAFKWLGATGCLLQSPTLTSLSGTMTDNTSLSDNNWISSSGDASLINNDEITFSSNASNYYRLSDTSINTLQLKMPVDDDDYQLLADATSNSTTGYRMDPSTTIVRTHFGQTGNWAGSMGVDNSSRVWQLTAGQNYLFRLEKYDLKKINPDSQTSTDFFVMSAFDTNERLISVVHKLSTPKQPAGSLGFFLRPLSPPNFSLPLQDIKIGQP
ncbi:MAG: hypothetical protein ACRBHB_02270 [Arenicella sp.]